MAVAEAHIDSIDSLSQFVSRARTLYSLPAVVLEVLDLTSNPKVDINALQKCIQNDPALTTRILKTVNSSLFGLNQKVASLSQALALLGTKPLKVLVLGFSLPREMFVGSESGYLSLYWRFTLTKAIASRRLMETLWKREGDDAFLAGLLQDIGMLVLLQDLGEPYAEFLAKVRSEGADLETLETAAFGFDHTVLSGKLLTHWNLPKVFVDEIITPMKTDQLAKEEPSQKVVQKALHLADMLARMLVFEQTDLFPYALAAATAFGDFQQDQIEDVVSSLQEKVKELSDLFSLTLPDDLSFSDVLARAHNHLAELSAELLSANNAGTLAEQERSFGPGPLKDSTDKLRTAINQYFQQSDKPAMGTQQPQNKLEAVSTTVCRQLKTKKAGMPPPVISPEPVLDLGQGVHGTPKKPTTKKELHELSLRDLGLVGRVTAAISSCRQLRRPLSLVLVSLDGYEMLADNLGNSGALHYANLVKAVANSLCKAHGCAVPVHDSCFTILLEGVDRRGAVEAGHQLVKGVEQWSRERIASGQDGLLTVSVGIATVQMPPKTLPASEMVEAANRCLYGVQVSGGNGVKSIEM